MKEALTIEELKSLAELFFNAGKGGEDFEAFFDKVMEGRYNKAIEQGGMQLRLREMQRSLYESEDWFNTDAKIKAQIAASALDDLQKIIVTSEKKYPIGGYAPGNYQCLCCSCGNHFIGDKRAVQCEPCAVKGKEQFDSMTDEQKEEHWNKVREEMHRLFPHLYPKH